MLPERTSLLFPKALQKRREQLGLSRKELAKLVNSHTDVIRRYEDIKAKQFSQPGAGRWLDLNIALGFNPNESIKEQAPIFERSNLLLCEATIDQLIDELRNRVNKNMEKPKWTSRVHLLQPPEPKQNSN